eukprot:CAMPEP_0198280288 /NCGR_PEP_ID=MMETSP1449-20131203/384_1 /TAXON_ID=420275 /ORGANISM="Attheya septentrionalis, Strain CCMP2084" /LENGTH=400 /DNA_ID=CAMNT_0043975595 /DNA_START=23 /DNA_END=1225 /DNA_ORIENTATION=+
MASTKDEVEEERPPLETDGVPVIDLDQSPEVFIPQIASACATYGFFQVINHGIDACLVDAFRRQMQLFFSLPYDTKIKCKRREDNSRGYFDDELTKQRRDWKEALDVGVPGSRDWSLDDDDERNACLDGMNQFVPVDVLPDFRPTTVSYFNACTILSDQLARYMQQGLEHTLDALKTKSGGDDIDVSLKKSHTSYLRMNYYPPCPPNHDDSVKEEKEEMAPLGISPHTDAGFLTVLVQDDDTHSLQVKMKGDEWVTVEPIPGALTINTGDMAMIWSNGLFKAPLHRVLTSPHQTRYSAPFFYNPGYDASISPFVPPTKDIPTFASKYHSCVWGYFRAVRFAGDLTDLGVEIQISNFLIESSKDDKSSSTNHHIVKQAEFMKLVEFHEPFSVEKYRSLLES